MKSLFLQFNYLALIYVSHELYNFKFGVTGNKFTFRNTW